MADCFSFFSPPSIVPAQEKKMISKEDPSAMIEALRFENMKLQREVEESQQYEAQVVAELEKVRMKLFNSEEAEERMCSQLGELEAESILQAREYNHPVNSLKQELARVEALLADAHA